VTPSEVETAVRSLRPLCVRWARSVVGGDAEDVAQAALEALVRKGPLIEAGAATAWLRTAVYYLARSHMRGRKELLVTGPELASDGDPEDTLASAQLSAAVQAALARVSSIRRPILVGVLADGRTLAAVAREEQIPESAARRRLADGTEDLRGALSRQRAAERRRTGGFSSFAAMLGLTDVRWGWLAPGLGAIAVGGALLTFSPTLAPTPDELPARAFVAAAVEQQTALPRAERGADRVEPVAPRRRHEAAPRMLAERVAQARR